MKLEDSIAFIFYLLLFLFTLVLAASGGLAAFNRYHAYLAGFVQFMVFGSAGDLLSMRLISGVWRAGAALLLKAFIWGAGGLAVTLAFQVFSSGVFYMMETDMLPFAGNLFAYAFFTSCANNVFFGPLHAAAMRTGANFAEMRLEGGRKICFKDAVESVNWGEFADFVLLKSIPFFWIPANTLVFLMPRDYRVALAASLSFLFGMSMALLKIREKPDKKSGGKVQSHVV